MKYQFKAKIPIPGILRGLCYGGLGAILPFLILWNYFILSGAVENLTGGGGNDFSRFYHATQSFLEGQGLYSPSKTTRAQWFGMFGLHLWDLNTPHFHIILLPLTIFSMKNAFILWALFSLLALAISIRIVIREITPRFTLAHWICILTGLLAFSGTGFLLKSGQISFLLLLPFTLAWSNARQNKWSKAGAYLGLCACIKPFLLIFLPYLLIKKFSASVRSFMLVFWGAFLVGILIFGFDAHQDWLIALSSVNWYWAGSNASILGFLTRTLAENPTFSVSSNAPSLIVPLWFTASILVGLVTILASVSGNTTKSVDLAFSILLVGAFLISPLGWTYYYFLLFPSLISRANDWLRGLELSIQPKCNWKFEGRLFLLSLSIPGFLTPMFLVGHYQPNPIATASIGSIYFWSTLLFWFSLVWEWYSLKKEEDISSTASWIFALISKKESPLQENIL